MREIYNGIYNRLLSFSTRSKSLTFFFISQFAALNHTTQNTTDESQAMYPIDFGYGNKTLDHYPNANAGWVDPAMLLLTVGFAIFFISCKDLFATTGSDEKRLATPVEIMQSLSDSREWMCTDRYESLKFSIVVGNVASSFLTPGLKKMIFFYVSDEGLGIKYEYYLSSLIFYLLGALLISPTFIFLQSRSAKRYQEFCDTIADRAFLTLTEVKQFKKSSYITYLKKFLFPFIIVATALPNHPVFNTNVLTSVSVAAVGALAARLLEFVNTSRRTSEIKALLNSHQAALNHKKEIAKCITVTLDQQHEIIVFSAVNSLFDIPVEMGFRKIVSFFQKKFSHNLLYFNHKKFIIEMIPMDTKPCSKLIWASFPTQLEPLIPIKKFISDGNQFFQEFFKIENAIPLTSLATENQTNQFTFELAITSLDDKQQNKIKKIIKNNLNVEVVNLLELGSLSIGPITQISQKTALLWKELRKEFKPMDEVKYQTSLTQVNYFIPDHLFWKRKKFKPQSSSLIEEKKVIPTAALFASKPIFFGDYGIFNPNDPHCLIQPLPGGPPNTFITLDAKLRKTLPQKFVWLTENFDEKIHTLPKIRFKPHEILPDGSKPFLKIFGQDEERLTSSQCIKVTSPNQKTVYTLFVVDQYHSKLHSRTTHASSGAFLRGEQEQTLAFA